jgi:radical SAM superfamily enzyme YgiQ (UPF0313 family)
MYRKHSAGFVIEHARYVVEELGVRHIYFVDDNVAQDQARFDAMLDGFIRMAEEGKAFVWETPNGMRTDRLTREILEKCRRAGCRSIALTVESGSQRVLNEVIHKKLDLDKVVEVAGWCKELGIKARAGFIAGLPGETLEDMEKTVEFAHMLRRRFGIKGHLSTATPYYGTSMHETCVEHGYITEAMTPDRLAVAVQGEGMIATEDFTVEDVKEVRGRFERRGGLLRKLGKKIERTVKRIARRE